jgi:sugar phosphate isomerase/epimerase
MQWVMFSKHLQAYTVEEAARAVQALGLDGLDLTVRPGGHIEPADAAERLPAALQAVGELGLAVPLLTTAITRADEPYAEDVFRLAGEAGVEFIKLGYWRYEGFGHLAQQINEVRGWLDGIEALARRHGVTAAIHTHSGPYVTAQGPVVARLLEGRDPAHVAAYVDPRHLFAEGGLAGWKMSLDLLAPWIRLVAIKDMIWVPRPDRALGKMRWVTLNAPLNVGVVAWPEVFDCLRQMGFDGLVSLHAEYQGDASWRDLSTEQVLEQTGADLNYLRQVLGAL